MTIYRWMKAHPAACWGLLALVVTVSAVGAWHLHYKEDITDFLPVDEDYRRSLSIYQDIAGGARVAVQFTADNSVTDTETLLTEAMESYVAVLHRIDKDGQADGVEARVEEADVMETITFCYAHLPLLLSPEDLSEARPSDTAWVRQRLRQSYRLLTSQAGGVAAEMIDYDPMGLFAPVGRRLQTFRPTMETHLKDGYLFAEGGRRSYVSLVSPYGNSETDGNARLMTLLLAAADSVMTSMDGVECHAVGAPVVAVENARQIRRDSWTALAIAAVLILTALLRRFRAVRPLLSIVAATGFGFLVALGFIALKGAALDEEAGVSVIVLGIASMLIGIAANYPLHYECHLQETGDTGATLRDLVSPLVIGNITTVGAFLALVPLSAVALRDLGLFAAVMLAGTVVFTLVWLPQMRGGAGIYEASGNSGNSGHSGLFGFSRRWPAATALVLAIGTAVLGWFATETEFDADFTHINYMSAATRADMERWVAVEGESDGVKVYAVVEDGARQGSEQLTRVLDSLAATGIVTAVRNPLPLLPGREEQQRRLRSWREYWRACVYINKEGRLSDGWDRMMETARDMGFSAEAFEGFRRLLTDSLPVLEAADFTPLTATVLSQYVRDGNLLVQVSVPRERVGEVEATIAQATAGRVTAFDQASLNARIATNLTDAFNWIGFECGAIVFLFLWVSFRRLEAALIAFLPMVIGWVWILGIMRIAGVEFNIVNIILATFIFGQGDDYTIFVTEGLLHDYRTGGQTSASYLRSIRLSAFIMLAGMGALITARHPAMRSLGEVTLVGMGVVFAMAVIVPPLLFRLFLKRRSFKNWMDR